MLSYWIQISDIFLSFSLKKKQQPPLPPKKNKNNNTSLLCLRLLSVGGLINKNAALFISEVLNTSIKSNV